jgi:hypothetical protein
MTIQTIPIRQPIIIPIFWSSALRPAGETMLPTIIHDHRKYAVFNVYFIQQYQGYSNLAKINLINIIYVASDTTSLNFQPNHWYNG